VIADILVNGLIHSGVIATLAVGFSLMFGVARILNLGYTAFYMLAAFLVYYIGSEVGLSHLAAVILSLLVTPIVGIVVYKLFIERIREHETSVILLTIGLAIIFQETFLLVFSSTFRSVPPFAEGYLEIIGVRLTYQQLITFGTLIILVIGLWIFLARTKLGLAIRATAQDSEIANLMGMYVPRIILIVMGIATALAAIAGVVAAPLYIVEPHMWTTPFVEVVAIVILGGLGSIKGSIVGAFILGFTQTLVVFLVPNGAFLQQAVALAVMAGVLLIKPEGLFGIVFEEERL